MFERFINKRWLVTSVHKEVDVDIVREVLTHLNSQQLLREILFQLQQERAITFEQLVQAYHGTGAEKLIPLCIFAQEIPAVAALCKYLKENEDLSLTEIGRLLGKSTADIWGCYQRAVKIQRKPFSTAEPRQLKPALSTPYLARKKTPSCHFYSVPLSIFQNQSLGAMGSIVLYLHQTYRLKNKAIAQLLHRHPNAIAVLLQKARRKSGAT